MDPFYIIGISVKTTNENGKSAKDIPALWGTFFSDEIFEKIPNKISNEVYGLYSDYEGDFMAPYTTTIGCKVSSIDSIPEGMVYKQISAGNYKKYTAIGDLNKGAVFTKWQEIWGANLKRSYTTDFEVYDTRAQDPTNAEVDIFIAID